VKLNHLAAKKKRETSTQVKVEVSRSMNTSAVSSGITRSEPVED